MARFAPLFAVPLMIVGCSAQEPDICRMSPPEDSDRYEEYLKLRSDAKCQEPAKGDAGMELKQ